MSSLVGKDHPKQKLVFFVAQDVDDSIRAKVETLIAALAARRRWLNGPPRFLDVVDDPLDESKGDLPVETLGGYLEIYSAWPPFLLPREVDLQHLDEVTTLLTQLCEFSRHHGIPFELELDGAFVGRVLNGEMDASLAEGLLGEWRRQLEGA
jgi:hypothetical protein